MPVVMSLDRPARSRGLMLWRILVWLLLLVCAFGCLQYLQHGELVWAQLHKQPPPPSAEVSTLHGMLAWDVGYLLAAFGLIVICAGCILRQAWARPSLRVAAVVLVCWLLVSGYLQWHDLQSLSSSSAAIVAQAQQQGTPGAVQFMAKLERGYQLALAFKVVGLIAFAWLAWTLGKPATRAQFRSRR
jgi:hypothetical protein